MFASRTRDTLPEFLRMWTDGRIAAASVVPSAPPEVSPSAEGVPGSPHFNSKTSPVLGMRMLVVGLMEQTAFAKIWAWAFVHI